MTPSHHDAHPARRSPARLRRRAGWVIDAAGLAILAQQAWRWI